MNRRLLLAAVALVLPAGVLACSGASPADPQPSPTPTPAAAAAGPREVQAGAPIGDPTSGPPAHEAKVVYVGPKDRPAVALTFDTGVDAGFMPEVLDILKKHGTLGTFGITGEWAVTNPDLLKRIAADGHAIVNHSWDHPSFTGEDTETPPLDDKAIRDQLKRTEDKIVEITGVSTKPYFRPPYGDYDSRVDRIAFEEGYEYNVLWYADGLGWEGRTTGYAINVTLKNAFNGAIYLYHTDNPTEYRALDDIIDGLEERGFQLLTIPQLLGNQPTPTPTPTPTPAPAPAPAPVPVRRPAAGATPPPQPTPVPSPVPSPVYTRLAFDDFESGGRSGGSGWLGQWQTSDPFVTTSCIPHSGGFCLDLSLGGFYQRAVNLSGRRNVHLRFWARLSDLEPGRKALVAVMPSGGQFQVVKEFTAAESDGKYRPYDIDLSGVPMSGDFRVVFESQLAPLTSRWHLDDVELGTVTP